MKDHKSQTSKNKGERLSSQLSISSSDKMGARVGAEKPEVLEEDENMTPAEVFDGKKATCSTCQFYTPSTLKG
jgi:hypothetical protein